jgi:hypothetical protein
VARDEPTSGEDSPSGWRQALAVRSTGNGTHNGHPARLSGVVASVMAGFSARAETPLGFVPRRHDDDAELAP